MGGLIGKFSFDPQEPLARPVLEQMLEASRQRPAHRDVFSAPGIALGAYGEADRASIAAQELPLLRAAADAAITNGAALRAELRDLGHTFDTTADSELTLRAYAQWSLACFGRFRGPFACAVWDGTTRRLVLARDQIGIRPLHFALLPNHGVVFASEIRSLLCDPGVPREWCPEAIDAYLALGYVPAPLTAYRRISKLESAHVLVIEGRRLHVERYWDIPAPQPSRRPGTIEEIRHDLRRVMDDQASTGIDGLLYSGGVGSTTLLASAPQRLSRVVTVAMDLDGAQLTRSDRAASHLGYLRELEHADPIAPDLVRELGAHCDEPVADPVAVSQLALCRAARRHTERAFSAVGAATLWSARARPRAARALWDDHHRRALYTRAFAWQVRDANPFARHLELSMDRGSADPVERALYVDAHTFLPDSEIVIAEHVAAASGLELRYPLLDPILVARAGAAPRALTRRAGPDRCALRLLLEPSLPRELLPPPRRPGATCGWLDSTLSSLVPSMLLSTRFDSRDIVSRPTLRGLWEEHHAGRHDHAHGLWSLLMLEFWFRNRIDGDAADEPAEYAVLKAA